jgi:uncharacterized protein YtpQ (UPF0354 family)
MAAQKPPDLPSKDAFAQLVMDRLRETGLADEIVYDPEEFQLSFEGEKQSVLFLENTYREYCTLSVEDRDHSIRRFVRGWLQAHKSPPEEYADIRPDILPAVRSRAFFELARLRMFIEGSADTFLPYQTIGDDLAVGLVYDMPDSLRPISNKQLDLWDVTFYEALESARENLAQLHPMIVGPNQGEGTYVFATNDSYDSSRLILLDLIRQFQIKGDFIAMAPGREMLIVTGSEDRPGLEAMVELANKAFEQPRTVAGVALRLDRDEWVPWMPDAAHPLYDEFRLLRMRSFGKDYAEQKELLDRLHEQADTDVFVASFSVIQHQATGHRMSYCVWTKDTHSLLPRTEKVIVGGPDQEPIMVAWNRVVQFAGNLMSPTDMYPERYRVDEFPSAEQLAAMGNELDL